MAMPPKGSRRGVCGALDPLPTVSARGVTVHRHCLLPAGHTGMHASYHADGVFIRGWEWDDPPPASTQERLV
jgi:hypothetical protein